MPNEDDYWEAVRERLENPPHSILDESEPETDYLWLDDLIDDLETEYNCDVSELPEGDLLDIVARSTDREPITAAYDDSMFCIRYQYMAA